MPAQIISKRLQEILKELGWTKEMLAEKSGLPIETIRNLWYGRTPDPKVSTLAAISEATGHTINCFLGKCPHTPKEKALLRMYRSCGWNGRDNIELVAKYESELAKQQVIRRPIPCVVPHGDIHKGILYSTCETVNIEVGVSEAYVGIEMTNNDLAPKFCKGDTILFENRFPQNGEYAAFFRGDRVYIRKFIEEDKQYRLKCLHNHDADIILKRMDEVQYIGTCCGVIRS